jgi:hypothetical protein
MVNKRHWSLTSDSGWEKWRLRFGKHRGRTLAEIVKSDPDYLIWLSGTADLNALDAPRVEVAMLAALAAQQSRKTANSKPKQRRAKG